MLRSDKGFYAITDIRGQPGKIDTIIPYIMKFPRVHSINTTTGDYDAEIHGRFSDQEDFEDFINHHLGNTPSIQRLNTRIDLGSYYQGKRVVGSDTPTRTHSINLDELDRKILQQLTYNSRKTAKEIGKLLSTTSQTIGNRIRRLEKEKIISGYRAVVNWKKLGFNLRASVALDVDPNRLKYLIKELGSIPEIFFIDEMTGRHDIHLQIVTKNINSFRLMLREKIDMIPGVRSTKVSYIIRSYRRISKNKFVSY